MSASGDRKRKVSHTTSPSPQTPATHRKSSAPSDDLLVKPTHHSTNTTFRPSIVVQEAEHQTRGGRPLHVPTLTLNQDDADLRFDKNWQHLSQQKSRLEDPVSSSRSGNRVDGMVNFEPTPYTLFITFEGERVPVTQGHVSFRLNDASDYRNLESAAEAHVRRHCESRLAGKSLHFRTGDCTIIGDDSDNHVYGLSSLEDWNDICTVLESFRTSKRYTRRRLDITRDYFGLLTRRITEETFASLKRSEIWGLMKETFDGRRYIPRTDLARVTSNDIVRQIIMEDPITGLGPDEQEYFIRDVLKRGRKLLAMCLHAQLRMACLKVLLDRNLDDNWISDNNFLERQHCCHSKCGPNFEILLQYQGGFSAAEFLKPGEHKRLHRRTVVPIQYIPVESHRLDDFEEGLETRSEVEKSRSSEGELTIGQRACCGSGAYSNVYRVRLDQAHHRLSKNRNADFALKIFKARPLLRTGADFNKELQMLDELRKYPNDRIVTHVATWTQDDRYYMLFPYAQFNIRQYMSRRSFGKPTKKNILWLLDQLRGLANALREIHNLSTSDDAAGSPSNLLAPRAEIRKAGWHHDLKPSNILVLGNPNPFNFEFHIADLGLVKVHNYHFGDDDKKVPIGTRTYEPPEAAKGLTSRPHDIWSMGCVFLELLIWAVFDYESVKTFARNREGRRLFDFPHNFIVDDAFWEKQEDDTLRLRQAVHRQFEVLRTGLQNNGFSYFEKLLDLVIVMLDTDRLNRITALALWKTLDTIFKQAILDMKRLRPDDLLTEMQADDSDSRSNSSGHSSNPGSTFSVLSAGTNAFSASEYSVEEQLTAVEEFVKILVDDEKLGPLYETCMNNKNIGPERFVTNFRRLLQIYAKALKNEATDTSSIVAAGWVHNRASYVSARIRERFDPNVSSAHFTELMRSPSSEELRLQRLNDCIPSPEPQSMIIEPMDESSNLGHFDEADDDRMQELDEERDQSELPSLSAVRAFLVRGSPLLELRTKFEEFVQKSVDGIVKAPPKVEANETRDTMEVDPITFEIRDSLPSMPLSQDNGTDSMEIVRSNHGSNKVSDRGAEPTSEWLYGNNNAEPPVAPGEVRIRWICLCGTALWDDFKELRPGAAEDLQRCLRSYTPHKLRYPKAPLKSYLHSEKRDDQLPFLQGSEELVSGTSKSIDTSKASSMNAITEIPQRTKTSTSESRISNQAKEPNELDASRSASQGRRVNQISTSDTAITATVPERRQGGPPQEASPLNQLVGNTANTELPPERLGTCRSKYLLLCLGRRNDALRLHQLNLESISDDVQLFELLRKKHLQYKGIFTRSLWPKRVVSVNFRKLERHPRDRVVILNCEGNEILPQLTNDIACHADHVPPRCDTTYDIFPIPPDLQPYIGRNGLEHLLTHPHEAQEEGNNLPIQDVWLKRFPKKITKLTTCPPYQYGLGWGVELEERWHLNRLLGLIIVVFVASSVMFTVCWWSFRGDIQGATSMAALLVGFATFVISVVAAAAMIG